MTVSALIIMSVAQNCPICLEGIYLHSNIHTTECNHTFHTKCFKKLRNVQCPCCRSEVVPDIDHQKLILQKDIRDNCSEIKLQSHRIRLRLKRHKHDIFLLKEELHNTLYMMNASLSQDIKDGLCYLEMLKRNLLYKRQGLSVVESDPIFETRRLLRQEKDAFHVAESAKLYYVWRRYCSTVKDFKKLSSTKKQSRKTKVIREFMEKRTEAWKIELKSMPKMTALERNHIKRGFLLEWDNISL